MPRTYSPRIKWTKKKIEFLKGIYLKKNINDVVLEFNTKFKTNKTKHCIYEVMDKEGFKIETQEDYVKMSEAVAITGKTANEIRNIIYMTDNNDFGFKIERTNPGHGGVTLISFDSLDHIMKFNFHNEYMKASEFQRLLGFHSNLVSQLVSRHNINIPHRKIGGGELKKGSTIYVERRFFEFVKEYMLKNVVNRLNWSKLVLIYKEKRI